MKTKIVITLILINIISIAAIGNSYFQYTFFEKKMLLAHAWCIFFVIFENISKVIIEVIAMPLFNITKGFSKFITITTSWVILLFILTFSVFQTFSTRIYLSELETKKDTINLTKEKIKRLDAEKNRLLKKVNLNIKREDNLMAIERQKTKTLSRAMKKIKNQWSLHKLSKNMYRSKRFLAHSPNNKLETKIEKIDDKIMDLKKSTIFNFSIVMNELIQGKIQLYNFIPDIGISVFMDAIIFIMALALGFLWKKDILQILSARNIKKTSRLSALSKKKPKITPKQLKDIMKENILDDSKFASLLGISEDTLYGYVDGKAEIPFKVIEKLDNLKKHNIIN